MPLETRIVQILEVADSLTANIRPADFFTPTLVQRESLAQVVETRVSEYVN